MLGRPSCSSGSQLCSSLADCCWGHPVQNHLCSEDCTRINNLPCPSTGQTLRTVLQHNAERQNNSQGPGRALNAVRAARFSRKPAKAGEAAPKEDGSSTDRSGHRAFAQSSSLPPAHCSPPPFPALDERESSSNTDHLENSSPHKLLPEVLTAPRTTASPLA